MKVLIIDNYDSFTFNLVQLVGKFTDDIIVKRNDKITLDEINEIKPDDLSYPHMALLGLKKNRSQNYLLATLLALFIIFPMQLPESVKQLVDTIIGKIGIRI